MHAGHDADGLKVELVLRLGRRDRIARDESQVSDVERQIGEGELDASVAEASAEEREVELGVGFKIVESEALEVGEQDVAGDLGGAAYCLEILNVVEGLDLGSFQARASGLVLD